MDFGNFSFDWLSAFLIFSFGIQIFHLSLDWRQLRILKSPHAPPELKAHFSHEVYLATRSYSVEKMIFGIFHSLNSFVQLQVSLLFGLLPRTWATSTWAASMVAGLFPSSLVPHSELSKEISHSIIFVLILIISSTLSEIPWSLYKTFVIEERHGFNKMTLNLFISDTLKSLLIMLVLIPPIIAGVTWILIVSGPLLAIYLWGFVFALSLVMMSIAPFIMSLFNKFEALGEGSPLKVKIETLAAKVGFPLKKLFSMDGSKRSGHSNAFMFGFGSNKRIVLFDTLIQRSGSDEEVVAVLAHELGHWKLGHTKALFILGQVITFGQFLAFTLIRNSPALYRSFGFDSHPALISLVLFSFISGPLDELIGFATHVLSRIFEFQADRFAVSLGLGLELKSALLKLEEENKGAMWTDPWYSAYHYTHPPLVERLRALTMAQDEATKKTS